MGVGSHRGEISRGSPYHNYMTTNLQLVKLKKWVHFKSIWETLAPKKYTYLVYHRSHTVKTCCTSDSARASLEWILLILCRLVLTFSQCSHWLLFAKHPQWVQPCVCCISINNSRELCVHMPLFTRPCRTRQLNSCKIITACFLFSVKCLLYKFLCIERWTSGRFNRVKKNSNSIEAWWVSGLLFQAIVESMGGWQAPIITRFPPAGERLLLWGATACDVGFSWGRET